MPSQSESARNLETLPSRWARAVQGDLDAFRELAASYWYCVYVWWRRTGLEAEPAATATVACFTRWAGLAPPGSEDSGVGLMRQWLPARLGELAMAEWEEEGEPAIEVEREWAEQHYADEPEGEPGAVFDRRWTLTVLEFAMQGLRAEYAARGLETLFAEASPFVGFERADEEHYAAAAERIGMTLGTMRRAIFDLRTHHRDLLRTIVADTVADPAAADGEISALLCAYDLPGGVDERPAPLPTAIRTFKPDELLARAMNSVHMTGGGVGTQWNPPSDADAARLFPQYEMRGLVGRGAMGAVYRARQVALDREVAIKLLPVEVSVDASFADRFVREARAMAKLSHPNIISVYNFGTTVEGHLFFVMEYVEGADLLQLIRNDELTPAKAIAVAGQVCTALAYAHGKGVIHRDIKPANVMVNSEGVAKVADFGLARLNDANVDQYGQTVTGTIMGTEEYMAPEQKRGMAVDHRADIFSMGVMLYEMICKEPPQGAFEPLSERVGCDARIDQIVLKAMNRTPEDRFQSATDMKIALDASCAPLPATRQLRQRPPTTNVAVSRPYQEAPPEKSGMGKSVAITLAAVLAIGAGIFLVDWQKKPAAKSVPTVEKKETATPEPAVAPTPPKPAESEKAADTPAKEQEKTPAPAGDPSANAAPAAAAKSAMEQWLADVDGPQQEAFQKQVAAPFALGMEELRKSYLAALDAGQAKASSTGNLEQAIIWNDERKAFEETKQVAPDDDSTPAPLLPLRTAFRSKLAKLESERTSRAKTLASGYDSILAKNFVLLTERGRTEDALLLKNKREDIARTWLNPVGAATVKSPAPEELIALAESSVRNREAKALLYPLSPDGWENLFARLTPALLKQTGPGWRIEAGTLSAPNAERALLPLPGTFSGISYQLRVKLRQLNGRHGFHLILPVGDRMTMLDLDGFEGQYTGLSTVDGKAGKDLPGVVEGRQVKDSEPHDFEVIVRLNGANARITTTLDARPLYEWTGPIASLSRSLQWDSSPLGCLAVGVSTNNWLVSEVKVKRLEEPGKLADTGAYRLPTPKVDATGWADLLVPLTPAIVEKTGHGWRMERGALFSPDVKFAILPLPGIFSDTSYQVRVKMRQLQAKDIFLVRLPVADRVVGFYVDGNPGEGYDTTLACVNGEFGRRLTTAVLGKQVKDSEWHELEVTVSLDGENAKIASTLDARPLYEWAGPIASLGLSPTSWTNTSPGSLALGTVADDWVVSEVKVKRLAEAVAAKSVGLSSTPVASSVTNRPPPGTSPEAEVWQDLLAGLTAADIKKSGGGWEKRGSTLHSPANGPGKGLLPLPGAFSDSSYQVHVRLRQELPKAFFYVSFPVGNRMTAFILDWENKITGLIEVDGRGADHSQGSLNGKQVKDSKPHNLELTVRPDGANATISVTLDKRPFYEWSGAITAVGPSWLPPAPPGTIGIGTNTDDWQVSDLKVRRFGPK